MHLRHGWRGVQQAPADAASGLALAVRCSMWRTALLAVALSAIAVQAASPMVRAGGLHTVALHSDGSVRSWGDDHSGALGLGRQSYFPNPQAVQDLARVRKLSAGSNHVVALLEDGSVWAWGDNSYQQL